MGIHFRRRPVSVGDLPPVTPNRTPAAPNAPTGRAAADTEPAVTALRDVSAAAGRITSGFAGMATAVGDISSTLRATVGGRTLSPEMFAEFEVNKLTAVRRPSGIFAPATYQVAYHRIGRHGRRGTPAPVPLTVHAATSDSLRAAIVQDAAAYLNGTTPDVLVDMQVMGGTIRTPGGSPAGTFTLHVVAYDPPTPSTRQETTTP
jgi:hypothetical protein